ncbi:MAG TPA: FbpB family small basic protein [Bacillales bacterium]|nr:FbpB family small basic protein [Bacillales bacterium]
MRKRRSLKELMDENKRELLSDNGAIEKIERKLEEKHSNRI